MAGGDMARKSTVFLQDFSTARHQLDQGRGPLAEIGAAAHEEHMFSIGQKLWPAVRNFIALERGQRFRRAARRRDFEKTITRIWSKDDRGVLAPGCAAVVNNWRQNGGRPWSG